MYVYVYIYIYIYPKAISQDSGHLPLLLQGWPADTRKAGGERAGTSASSSPEARFGFRGLGVQNLGFRVWGFRGLGFRGLAFRV